MKVAESTLYALLGAVLTLATIWNAVDGGLPAVPGGRALLVAVLVGVIAGGCTISLLERLDSELLAILVGLLLSAVLLGLRPISTVEGTPVARDVAFLVFLWLAIAGLVRSTDGRRPVEVLPP